VYEEFFCVGGGPVFLQKRIAERFECSGVLARDEEGAAGESVLSDYETKPICRQGAGAGRVLSVLVIDFGARGGGSGGVVLRKEARL
jgi:hypothetical protein